LGLRGKSASNNIPPRASFKSLFWACHEIFGVSDIIAESFQIPLLGL